MWREILRTARLDANSKHDRPPSLAKVQRIGEDAGLDPTDVARAAASLQRPEPGGGLFGAQFRGRFEDPLARLNDRCSL
jgi:hypothetical protein